MLKGFDIIRWRPCDRDAKLDDVVDGSSSEGSILRFPEVLKLYAALDLILNFTEDACSVGRDMNGERRACPECSEELSEIRVNWDHPWSSIQYLLRDCTGSFRHGRAF